MLNGSGHSCRVDVEMRRYLEAKVAHTDIGTQVHVHVLFSALPTSLLWCAAQACLLAPAPWLAPDMSGLPIDSLLRCSLTS